MYQRITERCLKLAIMAGANAANNAIHIVVERCTSHGSMTSSFMRQPPPMARHHRQNSPTKRRFHQAGSQNGRCAHSSLHCCERNSARNEETKGVCSCLANIEYEIELASKAVAGLCYAHQ